MMRYDSPCLKRDWKHAHLMKDCYEHVFIDGVEMTAENVWNYEGSRDEIVAKLADFFYNEGFKPWNEMSSEDAEREIVKLFEACPDSALDAADGSLKNTSRLCLDICRDFCRDSFYATRTNGTPSVLDVYRDKKLLERVLKNRLGWYTTTEPLKLEDGIIVKGEHPYLFDISHKMVVQGCHSSMVSANVSNFRPLVAKFLMSRFCPASGKVLDLSMGWGARLLAAMSLGLSYYGIDPMTADELDKLKSFVNSRKRLRDLMMQMNPSIDVKLVKGVSEIEKSYESFPHSIDYAIACPPYFKLEDYECKDSSTRSFSEYESWLESYWHKTVECMKSCLCKKAKFTLIMVEKWGKLNLLEDMSHVIEQEGFTKIDELSYKTTRSHLTDKRNSKNMSKSTEKACTFEKK